MPIHAHKKEYMILTITIITKLVYIFVLYGCSGYSYTVIVVSFYTPSAFTICTPGKSGILQIQYTLKEYIVTYHNSVLLCVKQITIFRLQPFSFSPDTSLIVVTRPTSYYDQRANYALKSSWTRSLKGCCNPILDIWWHKTIHQAIGVYMHWVIFGMELEY